MEHTWLHHRIYPLRHVFFGVLAGAVIIFLLFFEVRISPRYAISRTGSRTLPTAADAPEPNASAYIADVLPESGVELPVAWGDFGKQMIDSGVISKEAFESVYRNRGGLSAEERALLTGENNGSITINQENAPVLLNLFWAFGLANKNSILEQGPMQDPEYGGAGRFASTGGWTLATGDAMDHYSMHEFVTLNDEQQSLVERVSKGIYRPCCGNSVYFPDCNHGMAMLGLLELLASNGASEQDMYQYALSVNAYWFPETYLTIAKYLDMQGLAWSDVSPQEILGPNFSSSAGYQNILSQVEPVSSGGGGSCGV